MLFYKQRSISRKVAFHRNEQGDCWVQGEHFWASLSNQHKEWKHKLLCYTGGKNAVFSISLESSWWRTCNTPLKLSWKSMHLSSKCVFCFFWRCERPSVPLITELGDFRSLRRSWVGNDCQSSVRKFWTFNDLPVLEAFPISLVRTKMLHMAYLWGNSPGQSSDKNMFLSKTWLLFIFCPDPWFRCLLFLPAGGEHRLTAILNNCAYSSQGLLLILTMEEICKDFKNIYI